MFSPAPPPWIVVCALSTSAAASGCGCDARVRTPARPGASSQPAAWSEPVIVDLGGGTRGPWRQNESEYDYVDDPTIALRGDGTASVAWVDQAQKDVLFQRFDSSGKPLTMASVNVSRTPDTFSWLPRLVTSGVNVAVLWQEIVFSGGSHGGEIFFSRSTDDGRSFAPPLNLTNTVAGDGKGRLSRDHWDNGSLDLVAGPRDQLFAAWTEYEGGLWFARSDGGLTFGNPVRVAGSQDRPARAPSLAVARDGRLLLAWTVGEDPKADIHWAASNDEGLSFSPAKVAVRSEGHSDAPKLAVDRSGTVHLVFGESSTGPGGQHSILYARAKAGEEVFGVPRVLTDADGAGHFPDIDVGAEETLCLVWERRPSPTARFRGLNFAFSKDGGSSFSAPALIPGTQGPEGSSSGGRQGLLMRKVSCNQTGLVAVVHTTFQENVGSRVILVIGSVASSP